MCLSGLMVSNLEHNFGGLGSLPEGVNKSLFFNFDIKNFLLKSNGVLQLLERFNCLWVDDGGVEQRLLFIASLCSWFIQVWVFQRESKIFLFVCNVNQGNEEAVLVQDFLK